MPKIHFVAEDQDVQTQAGQSVRQAALSVGICPNREYLRGLNCGGHGICGTCKVWVHESGPGATSEPNLRERLHGMGFGRRLACQTKVLGDIDVTTMPGGDDRLQGRTLVAAPRPTDNPSARRKPDDEGSSIGHPLGHPSWVGDRAPAPPKASKKVGESELAVTPGAKAQPASESERAAAPNSTPPAQIAHAERRKPPSSDSSEPKAAGSSQAESAAPPQTPQGKPEPSDDSATPPPARADDQPAASSEPAINEKQE
jgi:ferredoxin